MDAGKPALVDKKWMTTLYSLFRSQSSTAAVRVRVLRLFKQLLPTVSLAH